MNMPGSREGCMQKQQVQTVWVAVVVWTSARRKRLVNSGGGKSYGIGRKVGGAS